MTDKLLPVAICFLTYKRVNYATESIKKVSEFLKYSGDVGWYIANDGSDDAEHQSVIKTLASCGQNMIGNHNERLGPGNSWNRAINECFSKGYELIFWLEDDWVLDQEFSLDQYSQILHYNPSVGMLRFSNLPINLNCTSVGYDGSMFLKMHRNMQYGFSGNPSLRHKRFFDAYGLYNTVHTSPGDCELAMDAAFRSKSGPDILWPVRMGEWGVFKHIGAIQSY